MPRLKKISKQESLELFNRVLECIRTREKGFFCLKKLRGVHGYCEWDDGIILDYRKDFIPTIIHECIHFIEPDWSEAQVCYAEKRVVNALQEQDIIDLLKIFIKKL